jgi:hypothetical protein
MDDDKNSFLNAISEIYFLKSQIQDLYTKVEDLNKKLNEKPDQVQMSFILSSRENITVNEATENMKKILIERGYLYKTFNEYLDQSEAIRKQDYLIVLQYAPWRYSKEFLVWKDMVKYDIQ